MPHIHKALRRLKYSEMTQKKKDLQQNINAMIVTYVGDKNIQLILLFVYLNILYSPDQLTIT